MIFLLLCINYVSFRLSGNEEQYLSIAKQYLNPAWIPNSFHLNEWAGARIINQTITSFFLLFLTIPTFAFWAKIINFALYSLPLAKILKKLKISNVEALLFIQVFYLYTTHGDQAFFADEWIFASFQGKTLAYIFIFYSLHELLEGRLKRSILFSIAASYFHVLVGGWFFSITFFYMISSGNKTKELLKLGSLYFISMSPLIIFLASKVLLQTKGTFEGVTFNWIYVYFRHAHHIGIFDDLSFFKGAIFGGLRTCITLLVIGFFVRPKLKYKWEKTLLDLSLISLFVLFFFVGVAFFDRYVFDRSGTFLLQLYPFRIAAISKFMLLLFSIHYLKEYIVTHSSKKQLQVIFLIIVSPLLLGRATKNIMNIIKSPHIGALGPTINELSSYIAQNTKKTDNFIIITGDDDTLEPAFFRAIQRGRFASYKFVPAGTDKLFKWYFRILDRRKLEVDIQYIDTIREKYNVQYLISHKLFNHPALELTYKNNDYYLYAINGVH